MTTAVDTNVLVDIFRDDPQFSAGSTAAIRRSRAEGGLVACDVVWAETIGLFPSPEAAAAALDKLGVEFDAVQAASAVRAGMAWAKYRGAGGTRDRLVADFLVGAHALKQADRLLTRDRGFYRMYFSRLVVLDPSA